MSNIDDRRIANLWEVLKSYADTPENIKACQHVISRTETTNSEIILDLISIIYNGVYYGNWPWNPRHTL